VTPTPRVLLLTLVSAAALLGCPSRESVGTSSMSVLGAGVVNDPENRSLRFDMLKFGLESFCAEMLKGGAPLKLADDQPVAGRFFAQSCQSQILDEDTRKSFIVQYQGKGYAWANPLGRVGFTAAGLIEYAPDFQRHEDALYVYFRPRLVDATAFKVELVESATAQTTMSALGVNPEELGKRIVDGQLRRGFTVIRYSSRGETEFGMGVIALGEHPFRPFDVRTEDKRVILNERTEVHQAQQDYVGAFEVEDDDQALFLTLTVDGAPAVDALLLPESTGAPLVDQYLKTPGPIAIPEPVLMNEVVATGDFFRRFVPVPKGRYFLVIDNSDKAGRTQSQFAAHDDRAAKVDYLVMVGEAP
jgi:hypothetical protein